jgi:MFS family permease
MFLQNTFRAFRHRDYFIFWCGLFIGHSGTLVQSTAQGWLIFQLTNSPFYLGLDGLCLGLPRVLFSAFGGAVVDRADRRRLFLITQSAFLVMSLFLAVTNYLGHYPGLAYSDGVRAYGIFRLLRATRAPVHSARAGAACRVAQRSSALSNGFQRFDAFRAFDWRFVDTRD